MTGVRICDVHGLKEVTPATVTIKMTVFTGDGGLCIAEPRSWDFCEHCLWDLAQAMPMKFRDVVYLAKGNGPKPPMLKGGHEYDITKF